MSLTRAELQAERAASKARQEARRAAEPNTPNPYVRKRFDDFTRKPASWWDDVYVPPMDVTEVLW